MSTGEPALVALVALVDVDEAVLDELVRVATTDASAAEVTPPLTDGDSWTAARVAWLREYHRGCRAGLDGPTKEATWAVVAGGGVAGSVRLKRTKRADVLETGIWLARRVRGRGIATAASGSVLQMAAALGATAVRADTTTSNGQALALLERTGFSVNRVDGAEAVHALVEIRTSTSR